MRGRKLIATALLAGMVSSPMVMAEVLSDKDLGSVSAQGFQVAVQTAGAHEQNINNDSVQLNDNAQAAAAGMAVTNTAASAANVAQNVVGVTGGLDRDAIYQRNDQTATNAERSEQVGRQLDVDYTLFTLGVLANVQNLNNGSTQLNGNAQAGIVGMAVTNAASSAANVAQNVVGLSNSAAFGLRDDVRQANVQVAENQNVNGQFTEQVDVDGNGLSVAVDVDRQNINNGSTQLNDQAQAAARVIALTNSASSASNTAQNIIGISASLYDEVSQVNDQYAENVRINGQLSGQGEADVQVLALSVDFDKQSINNGSTQLNENAQFNVIGMVVSNLASSVANTAQNVAGIIDSSTGWGNDITQRNNQVALNAPINGQGGVQLDLDVDVFGGSIDIDEQNLNNGSVQLNDNAQERAAAMVLTNSASSALNVGQNIVGIVDSRGDDVRQVNNQYAEDVSINAQDALQLNVDTGLIDLNYGEAHANNGSVQLNDNAQAAAVGMVLTNTAGSAVNVAQNIVGMANGYSGTITQTNIQTAVNY